MEKTEKLRKGPKLFISVANCVSSTASAKTVSMKTVPKTVRLDHRKNILPLLPKTKNKNKNLSSR